MVLRGADRRARFYWCVAVNGVDRPGHGSAVVRLVVLASRHSGRFIAHSATPRRHDRRLPVPRLWRSLKPRHNWEALNGAERRCVRWITPGSTDTAVLALTITADLSPEAPRRPNTVRNGPRWCKV